MNTQAQRPKPNSILPKGAQLIEPREVKLATWLPQIVDAEIVLDGIKWYRVKGGFGNRHDREDWIADVPGISISTNDYSWNGEDFGPDYGTFENACKQNLIEALRFAEKQKEKLIADLHKLQQGINKLQEAVR